MLISSDFAVCIYRITLHIQRISFCALFHENEFCGRERKGEKMNECLNGGIMDGIHNLLMDIYINLCEKKSEKKKEFLNVSMIFYVYS